MSRLASPSGEARRWLLALAGLVAAGVGLTLMWGAGWGLVLVGLGTALVVLLYDPERGRRP